MNWYIETFKKYTDFKGRARRREYWLFILFNSVFGVMAMILDRVLGIAFSQIGYGPIYIIYALVVLIPGIAVAVRRLHDIGKSGWMLLLSLIPLIGTIWLIFFMTKDSDPSENEYGPNPKIQQDMNRLADTSKDQTILLSIIIWLLVSRLFWAIANKFSNQVFSSDWFLIVNGISNLIWSVIPIGLAFLIKNKTTQFVLFILGGVYFVYEIYESFRELL